MTISRIIISRNIHCSQQYLTNIPEAIKNAIFTGGLENTYKLEGLCVRIMAQLVLQPASPQAEPAALCGSLEGFHSIWPFKAVCAATNPHYNKCT